MTMTAEDIADYAIEIQERGNLSLETMEDAEELFSKAVEAISEDEPDVRNLDFAMRILKRSIDEVGERDFLFDMGD